MGLLILAAMLLPVCDLPAQNVAVTYSYTHADPEVLERTLSQILPDRHQYRLDRSRKLIMIIAPEYVQQQFVPVLKHLEKPVKQIQMTAEWLGPSGLPVEKLPPLQAGDSRKTRLALPPPLYRLDWLRNEGAHWSSSPPGSKWDEVAAAFSVQPTIVGEDEQPMIRLLLIPELYGTVEGKPKRLQYTRAAIQLFVKSGSAVRLGRYIKEPAFYEQFLAGSHRQGQADQRDLLLTVTLTE